jgi:hypothetical protein
LEAGKHELLTGIALMQNPKSIDWVIGLGDPDPHQRYRKIFIARIRAFAYT